MIEVSGYFEQIIGHDASLLVLPEVVAIVEYNEDAVVIAGERLQRLEDVFEAESRVTAPDTYIFTHLLLIGFVAVFVVSRNDVLVTAGVFHYLPHSRFLVPNEGVHVTFDDVHNHFAVHMCSGRVKEDVILLKKLNHELCQERPHLDAIDARVLLGVVNAARLTNQLETRLPDSQVFAKLTCVDQSAIEVEHENEASVCEQRIDCSLDIFGGVVGADQVASSTTKQSVLAICRLFLSSSQNIVGNFAFAAEAELMIEFNTFAIWLLLGRCFNLLLLRFLLNLLLGSLLLTLVS